MVQHDPSTRTPSTKNLFPAQQTTCILRFFIFIFDAENKSLQVTLYDKVPFVDVDIS